MCKNRRRQHVLCVRTSQRTSAGLLQLVLQADVLLLQESDLTGELADRVQTLDVDVGRSTWRGQQRDVNPCYVLQAHDNKLMFHFVTFLSGGASQSLLQLLSEAVVGLDGILQSLSQTPDLSQVFLHQI